MRFFLLLACITLVAVTARSSYRAPKPPSYEDSDDAAPPPYHDDDDYSSSWEFYSADGVNNNAEHPEWGTTFQPILYFNITPVPFKAIKKDNKLINERKVSNIASAARHNQPRVTPRNVTDFLTAWAQFLDHDIVLTPGGNVSWPIPVPKCDRHFDPQCAGDKTIGFSRSILLNADDEFSHPSVVTAWIDGSQIYGSSLDTQKALRSFKGGKLSVSKKVKNDEGDWPPMVSEINPKFNFQGMANDAKTLATKKLFACGDVRCNEQPLLLALHVVFLREHNRVASLVCKEYPEWDDETVFQKTRAYVIAMLQKITFKEYLFWLMGGRDFDIKYEGYKPEVQPTIDAFFSTVAFRYGHSEVNSQIKRIIKGEYGAFPKAMFSQLRENFFDNTFVFEEGVNPIFEGMYRHAQSSMDNQATEDIRTFLFAGKAQKPSADLIAIDLRRARDHGIPKYNAMRRAYGLEAYDNWDDFEALDVDDEIDENELKAFLKYLYASPEDCDSFICGLCEDWVETDQTEAHDDYSNLGPLFEAALHRQFAALRDGDRFWYEQESMLKNLASVKGLPDITSRTLANIIRDNAKNGIEIDDDVFNNEGLVGLSRDMAEKFCFDFHGYQICPKSP